MLFGIKNRGDTGNVGRVEMINWKLLCFAVHFFSLRKAGYDTIVNASSILHIRLPPCCFFSSNDNMVYVMLFTHSTSNFPIAVSLLDALIAIHLCRWCMTISSLALQNLQYRSCRILMWCKCLVMQSWCLHRWNRVMIWSVVASY